MTARLAILDILADLEGDAADEALVAALSVVAPARQIEIVRLLLARKQTVGLTGLPSLLHKLDPQARLTLIEQSDCLFGALRTSARSSNAQTRQNTLEIISESGDARLAYLAAHAIHDGSPRIRAQAAATLFHLAQEHLHDAKQASHEIREASLANATAGRTTAKIFRSIAESREFIVAALDESLEHYESHHRPEIVEAAMFYATDLEPSLLKQSTIKRGKLSHAIEEILSQRLRPEHAQFVYIALSFQELRRKIVTILSRCHDSAFFYELIRLQWLGRDPHVRRHLAAIRRLSWLVDGYEATFNLPVDVAIAMPAWLLPLGLPVGEKISLLLNLLMLDDARVHRAAAWALTKIELPEATTALHSLLEHQDESVRRIARRELDHREHSERSYQKPRTMKSRPDEWARLLEAAGIGEDFESIWQNYERLDPGLAKRAGHHALKYINSFVMCLQTKLLSKSPADRLRALRIAQTLFLGKHFQKDVFAAANDTDVDIRTAAIATLGQVEGETTRRILERSLLDSSPVVRVAGIESIDALRLPHAKEMIEPLTDCDESDVRAAAVRCLLRQRSPNAANTLMRMLIDKRPDHRCAALWLVDQLKIHTVASRIRVVAEADPDPQIARIAQHVARRLANISHSPNVEVPST